jgi:stage II sporulation protein P
MERHPIPSNAPTTESHIRLSPKPFRKSRHFGAFLICCALFVAGFALTAVWQNADGAFGKKEEGTSAPKQEDFPPIFTPPIVPPALEDSIVIPEGATPIVNYDLSHLGRGIGYLNNETFYHPSINELLETDVTVKLTQEPLVLVLHTHTSEGYLGESVPYLEGDLGKITYTQNEEQNMLAVGKAFISALNKNGITAIHCTVMHDASGLSGSYERAAQSIQFFLTHYPSIRYVVDLHRDAILTSEGEYVRAVTEIDGKSVAQILPVVGSNAGGWEHDGWEGNLALALQMRQVLNQNDTALCRPVMLRNSTYNQEMAPYAILLEIGTGANSIDEAIAAATHAGEAFAKVILSH